MSGYSPSKTRITTFNAFLIALYVGLFSTNTSNLSYKNRETYCPLCRAILQLYLLQFLIRISHELPFFNRKFSKKWDNRFFQNPFEAAYLRGSLFLHLLCLRLPHFFLSYIFFVLYFPNIKKDSQHLYRLSLHPFILHYVYLNGLYLVPFSTKSQYFRISNRIKDR